MLLVLVLVLRRVLAAGTRDCTGPWAQHKPLAGRRGARERQAKELGI